MQFPAVNWHEGLFLQPHHFQAWDRHWTERVALGERWQSPYGYGVIELSLNRDALAIGFLQVDTLRCKTPGGALIDSIQGATFERRDLRPALEEASRRLGVSATGKQATQKDRAAVVALDVYVGVPRLQLGINNVDEVSHWNGARYRAHLLELPDETDAASVRPIELRQLNAKILLSTDDLAGYDLLHIARLRREHSEEVQVRLDGRFIPPLLDCASHGLMRSEILTAIQDLIQNISQRFAYQLLEESSGLHARTSIEVQRLMILQAVHPAAAVLQVLSSSRGVHPFTAYMELVRLAGALDLLHPQRVVRPTPAYDHENLGDIFFELKRRILYSVEQLDSVPYQHYPLHGYAHGMQVQLDPQRIAECPRWFLGINKGPLDAARIQQLMAPGNLDWKLGCTTQVERLFAGRAEGIKLQAAANAPKAFPQNDEWVYFEVDTKDSPAWDAVLQSGALAWRVADSSILNREQLQDAPEIIVRDGRTPVKLRVSLFGSV